MNLIKEYWYIGVIALIAMVFLANRRGGATQVTSGSDPVAMAQIASQEREADEARKFGIAQNVLNYDLSLRGLGLNREQMQISAELARSELGQRIQLAEISAEGQAAANTLAYQLAQLQANTTLSAAQQQAALQRYQYERAFNSQRRNDWLGAITTGIGTLFPLIFGQQTSGGSINLPRIGGTYGTPPIFPSGGGCNIPFLC